MADIQFPFPIPIILPLLPEIIVAVMAMVILIGDLFLDQGKKQLTAYAAIATCIVAGIATLNLSGPGVEEAFYGFFVLDPLASLSKLLLYAGTILGIILSLDYMKTENNRGEYYCLMLFALLGMMLMVSAADFIIMYLGMELMALSVYVLVGYQRDVLRSSEAALKYFILGALSSGMLLYGISFFYGLTGSTDFSTVGEALSHLDSSARFALMLGLVFLMAGMAFKVSVAPFHMWTPDAYEGAPTPITAFISTAPKVAGFVLFARLLMDALPAVAHDYGTIFTILAVLSLAVGNLAAIAQRSIKRMLAYSTIGHAGFALLGLLAGSADGYAAILLYLAIYIVMNMGAFAIIILMRREGIQGELLDDFAGLAKARPGYGLAMGIFMFSLAGIPFMGGFWAKYAIFAALIDAGHITLAVIAVLFAAIGAFYYLRVVKYIYFDEQRVAFDFVENKLMQATVAVTAIVIVFLGIFPGPLMDICKAALAGIV